MRSSKLQEEHLNKTSLLLAFAIAIQPFKIRVIPSVINSEVIFYFSRVAKKVNKFKGIPTVSALYRVIPKSKHITFSLNQKTSTRFRLLMFFLLCGVAAFL